MVQMRAALAGIPVSRAMLTDFQSLSPRDSLGKVIDLTLGGSQKDYPVVDGGRVTGVLMQTDLLSALSGDGSDKPVSDVMRRDFLVIDAFEMLETALRQLGECDCHTLPVTRGGKLVGLVTMDNIGEFLAIQAALGKSKRTLAGTVVEA